MSLLGDVRVEVSQELSPGGRVSGEDGVTELAHLGLQLHFGHERPTTVAQLLASEEGVVSPSQRTCRLRGRAPHIRHTVTYAECTVECRYDRLELFFSFF